MNYQKIFVSALVAIAGALGVFWYIQNLENAKLKYAGPVEKIRFGVETSILPSAVWVAESKGYFLEQGLDVEIKEYDSGKNALKAMLTDGGLDMVTVAQTPVMFNSFNRNDYAIIGAMVSVSDDVKMLGRQDKGVKTVLDLKGKKIGITKGSTGHFFLGLVLSDNGLKIADIEAVDFRATELAQALADGKVDAISSWEPHIANAKKLLGANAVIFSTKGIFREDFYFVAMKNFITAHPKTLERFLKAIEKGELFIQQNKEESIDIIAKRISADKDTVAQFWDTFEFKQFLDQSILTVLEDEARWAIDNNLTETKKQPNYLDYIYVDALKAVKPEVVTVIK